ncbi:MAG: translation elongation factor 4 [bacterium]
MKNTRNFAIIAHIDHGKSTLSDRLIEETQTLSQREMKAQVLDGMDLERERGITIKMQAVRMTYKAKDGHDYQLNLIDTPGHVDFTYEVSRSLAACEGALLLVDASQGIEAQTLANFYLALEHDLEIIPLINKIDLPSAEPERVLDDIELVLGIPAEDCVQCSAKTGQGVSDILEKVVTQIPSPKGDVNTTLQALVYDAHYDEYRGVIAYVRVINGVLSKRQKIMFMASDKQYEVLELGCFKPKMTPLNSLEAGEVGYLICNIKTIADAKIGDTITDAQHPSPQSLPGYKEVKPMVFSGFYPVDTQDYNDLKEALEKLKLNDAALQYEVESSQALGFGFRCGFLGLLHMEITQERIQREFGIELIITAPNVTYEIRKTDGTLIKVENPSQFPQVTEIETMKEPLMELAIVTPNNYLGVVNDLVKENRGLYKKSELLDGTRQVLHVDIPLNELIHAFFDRLKSATKGYASMDYSFKGYVETKLVKVDILIKAEPVDALSFICHAQNAETLGRKIVEKLKTLIPRQMFEVPLQAAIGAKVICRETISAMRKNVTAKCYGGDISRKRKLLEKQKKGKKKMKQIGSVEVPKEAFLSVLKLDK